MLFAAFEVSSDSSFRTICRTHPLGDAHAQRIRRIIEHVTLRVLRLLLPAIILHPHVLLWAVRLIVPLPGRHWDRSPGHRGHERVDLMYDFANKLVHLAVGECVPDPLKS